MGRDIFFLALVSVILLLTMAESCTDTPGWKNSAGFGCALYTEYGWCKNGDFTPGSEWTGGTEFNHPQRNCCDCGKGKPQYDSGCEDTQGWTAFGYKCSSFAKEGWCKKGSLISHGGTYWKHPSQNCCVCGKQGQGSPPTKQPSSQPTKRPTTSSPTAKPTPKPTRKPTAEPTNKSFDFEKTLGPRNGVPQRHYYFKAIDTNANSGRYSTIMVNGCKSLGDGWKPVCDHPTYCKTDTDAIYIGQDLHIAYPPYRNNNGYFPSGWNDIKRKWDGLCSYTKSGNGNAALCNDPISTHTWKQPNRKYKYMCAKIARHYEFEQTLDAKNGVPKRHYEFRALRSNSATGRFSDIMINGCKNLGAGWKPVCDHPSYCKNDAQSIYIGQDAHIAYPPDRDNDQKFPAGWHDIKRNWDTLCSYTASANGKMALCNYPSNTHSWQEPKLDSLYMCGKIARHYVFETTLGTKNGVPQRHYEFRALQSNANSGKFSTVMVNGCKNLGEGWKPVCDHPSYCKTDKNAIYIGQNAHIAYPPNRNNNAIFPSGWNDIKRNWDTLCSYTANANGNAALCNIPSTTHSWLQPKSTYLYMCAKIARHYRFERTLGPKNGVKRHHYEFRALTSNTDSGRFSDIMVNGCSNLGAGWKPICDHQSYCKNDSKSLYIGQDGHIAYPPDRNNDKLFPEGWHEIKRNWDTLCSYTGAVGGHDGQALCNKPRNTHSWTNPNTGLQYMCGKIARHYEFEQTLGVRNGVPQRHYFFRAVRANANSGRFSSIMIDLCGKMGQGWKPVCDHPSYCKTDKDAIYIGQDAHIAYPPNRNNNAIFPSGWNDIKRNWDTLCSYTAKANGNAALCNDPISTHSWMQPNTKYLFMCAKIARHYGFEQTLSAKNGVPKLHYEFRALSTGTSTGAFADIMINGCKVLGKGWKPVCDHQSYCKSDEKSIYIGQDKHIAYPPDRNDDRNFPSGWHDIKRNWDTLCSYTGKQSGQQSNALCNIPDNTHSWQKPRKGLLYMCAKILRRYGFEATLGERNGVPQRHYEFAALHTNANSGRYSTIMTNGCRSLGDGWKPVCDHPSYCKTDADSIYIGQDAHIAYPPNRNNDRIFPSGWADIKRNWDTLCSYTKAANGNAALCNIPSTTHSWLQPSSKHLYMCAKIARHYKFEATLDGKNGVPKRLYQFRALSSNANTGKFSDVMTKGCGTLGAGWKPICDHQSYCKNDSKSIYIGQDAHIAYPPDRNDDRKFPNGWHDIKRNWDTLCSYTANANGNNALCNLPTNTHTWLGPKTSSLYMCGKIARHFEFSATLGPRNGVPKRTYEFRALQCNANSGRFSTIMANGCRNLGSGWKPVCDHPSYCQNDADSIYIGQGAHIAYPPNRNNNSLFPSGWADIKRNWDTLCSYTKSANGNAALCNIPITTHSWQQPNTKYQYMCAKVTSSTGIWAAGIAVGFIGLVVVIRFMRVKFRRDDGLGDYTRL